MTSRKLSLACWDYDRTRALIDGRVKVEGAELDVSVMRPRVAFDRMLATGEFDICEMSFATYVGMRAEPECPIVAIPVMLSKMFRHDCIYVNADAGVRSARDLAGRRVGTMRYTSTALVFARGLLEHDFGVAPREMDWFVGGVDEGFDARRPAGIPDDIRMTCLTKDQTLNAMLEQGEIDALISQDLPSSFLGRSPKIRRLFPDFQAAEIDYFQRTGIFPVMHTIVLKAELHRADPRLAQRVYDAFVAAKDIALHGLYDTDALHLSLPFLIAHIEEARRVFGEDFFSYGLEPNRRTLEALCQYVHEQGQSARLVSPDELFAPVTG